ncbi:MAG: winged helix-turn-helix transcriptional regulator [Stenotrophomonas sp.]|uniref:MarR family winged helix-turn-helix transcriptional regulator n=1 Tax=Stenotrophomonas maltophilia TaxID=40324 RepID=UPI0015DC2A27|nr:MarR family winged helix-turn-helix transcriptional regulator [Stenotrophomonas maltophilia]MBW8776724.1 winged helix-turn-helix transcriptional regulator [Stenotrophomonas sp.]QDL27586.1 MarR family transcriptional regulator [Stenotrophomonas maltophilia]
MRHTAGLGELLRYTAELVDQGAEQVYRDMGLDYRARYTPVMRALAGGARTVGEITDASRLTQGAISQTVGLMIDQGLLRRQPMAADARKSALTLTAEGQALLRRLEPHWSLIFEAIGTLEAEIGHPLLDVLEATARALEQRGFAQRLTEVRGLHR